jgi:hypothetical protein
MTVHITLKVRLGPLVTFEMTGQSCNELSEALKGFELLNQQIGTMCSDLAERVYPEGMEQPEPQEQTEVQR